MSKYITNEELDSFVSDNNNRDLTENEIRKIELKKLIGELKKRHTNQPIIITKNGQPKPASLLTIEEQAYEIVRCGSDPIYFIETYLTVFDQMAGDGGKLVPFKLFPFQKELIRAFEANQENIANKYRQAGVSTTTCAYIAWYVMFTSDRYVALIADKLETARDELMSDVIGFIEGCPNYLRPSIATTGGKDSMGHKRYSNGSQMKAFATTKLRGPSPTLIFWDEAAWSEKGEKFWESASPAVRSTGGRVIFVSTPNGLDPIFYKTFDTAITKISKGEKPQVNPIELWWYNDPRYIIDSETKKPDLQWIKNLGKAGEVVLNDIDFTKEHRAKLITEGYEPTSSWFKKIKEGYNGDMRRLAQEVLCSFLGSGENFISEEYVRRIEKEQHKQPISIEWVDKLMYIYEEPIEGVEYIMGIDVASGRGADYTTLMMLKITDVETLKQYVEDGIAKVRKAKRRMTQQVAEYRGKMTPQQVAELAYVYGEKYNFALCIVDISGGYGVGTIESLISLGYKNIFYSEINHKPTKDMLNVYVKTKEVKVGDQLKKIDMVPGFIIGQNRALVLQEMERSIRFEDVIIRSNRLTEEFKTFIVVDKKDRLADHQRSFHDDLIMGLALCLYISNCILTRTSNNDERIKSMLDAILVINDNAHIQKPEEKHRQTDNFEVTRTNPYGSNAWIFQGMNKNR